MNIKKYLKDNGLTFSDKHVEAAFNQGIDTGIASVKTDPEFIEEVITCYYAVKDDIKNDYYMCRHDICQAIINKLN